VEEPVKKTILFICILLITLNLPGLCLAADKWEFIIAPYALVPYIDGDASVGRVEGAEVDVGPKDITENLDLGAMIQLEAHHESGYGISLAYNFMDLGGGATDPSGMVSLDAEIYQGILEGYGIYRVNTDRGPLDFYGGVRWWDMDVEIKINNSQVVDNNADWVDPVVGARWMPQIADNWHLILKGDIGGFGAASDFTWNLQGGIIWDATDYLSLVFQYRALSVDYSTGTVGTPDRFAYDTITHGPMFGLAFQL
jgi:hypothetical protein